VSEPHFCQACGRQLRPEWGDRGNACLRCTAAMLGRELPDEPPADPGNRVMVWFAAGLVVLAGLGAVAWKLWQVLAAGTD
jgi:hypothetical protein